jgi:hypothetical protein
VERGKERGSRGGAEERRILNKGQGRIMNDEKEGSMLNAQ